jgi:hypothetical protein
VTLEDLADVDTDEMFKHQPPITVELTLAEHPTPSVAKNLAKLQKLGILSGDTIMALVGQAPIDPCNLMGTLMHHEPIGWAFSAIDFTMFRVLARNKKKAVSAALRVDLMSNVIAGLALNQAGQLTIFKTLEVHPGDASMANIQRLCDETVEAAARETKP